MNSFDVYHVQFDRKTGEKVGHKLVACVTGENIGLEDVWRLTNTINDVWWSNDEVAPAWENFSNYNGRLGCRSSMVGDVIHDLDNDVWNEVDGFGFIETDPLRI